MPSEDDIKELFNIILQQKGHTFPLVQKVKENKERIEKLEQKDWEDQEKLGVRLINKRLKKLEDALEPLLKKDVQGILNDITWLYKRVEELEEKVDVIITDLKKQVIKFGEGVE